MTSSMLEPGSVKMSPSAVVVNDSTMNIGILTGERKKLSNPDLWHKVIVHNVEHFQRDVILKAILDDLQPYDFIPVFYAVEGTSVSFFVRNCRLAIQKLLEQNLFVSNPLNKDKPYKLTLILGYSNTTDLVVNVQDNIGTVLTQRYNGHSKLMNLDNFCKDPDLKEFCTLSQPKILYFVLHLSKQYNINSLKLSNNDIQLLKPIESICSMKSLVTLDLRNNLINEMRQLNILKCMHIRELYLDGNPLCDDYDEYSYVRAVREVCPKIEKLDGVVVGQKGYLPFRRNYLCVVDGQELIDQFLDHYFSLFDSENRTALQELYSRDALCSITASYIPGQLSSPTANVSFYKQISRNLKMMSDLSRNGVQLLIGGAMIAQKLASMPASEHDPYSFTVDLNIHSEKISVVTITGIFRERSKNLLDSEKILGFCRTFVLRAGAYNEYNIVNDQWHISNATTAQQQRAFKVTRVPKTVDVKVTPAVTPKDKREMEDAFKVITTLNLNWSKKLLDECKYDFAKALVMFGDLHKVDKIPEEAFT